MRAFLSQLIMPLSVFWLILLAGAILFYFRKKKTARYTFLAALGWLLMISTFPMPKLLVQSLENRYKPLLNVENLSLDTLPYIIVLGSGHTSDPRLPATNQLSPNALGRLTEGIRLHQSLPGSKLIVSGWGKLDTRSQAEVLAEAAVLMGVAREDVQTLTEPHNTRAEAIAFETTFGKTRPLILVTDAVHMPRAMMHFRHSGLAPIPAPTNHRIKQRPGPAVISLWPASGHIENTERAVHEYVGMLWAKITR